MKLDLGDEVDISTILSRHKLMRSSNITAEARWTILYYFIGIFAGNNTNTIEQVLITR